MKFVDLHLHTVYSDGTYTPAGVIAASKKAGLSAISVVDHDSVAGIDSVFEIAEENNIEVIPGIELSAECGGEEIHILGYLIDRKNEALLEKLEFLKNNRIDRIYKIVNKLSDIGVTLDPDSVFSLAKLGTVGRLHVARALLNEGKVKTLAEAFRKYIGDGCPAYVLGFKFSPKEAIELIKSCAGVPVLAHPYTINDDNLFLELVKDGIMGLEVYYPEHSQSMINFYSGLAGERGLLLTGGSDCHGNAKTDVKLGSIKIPYELVEKLKAAKEKLL